MTNADDQALLGPLNVRTRDNKMGLSANKQCFAFIAKKNLHSIDLKYHINAKHTLVSASVATLPQTTLMECSRSQKLSKYATDKCTISIAKWIAVDRRPINMAKDKVLMEVIIIASTDNNHKCPTAVPDSTLLSAEHCCCLPPVMRRGNFGSQTKNYGKYVSTIKS